MLRPVTPLRDPAIIDSAIDDFINNPEATSLRSAHEMSETAYKKVEIENNYFVTAITKSLDLDSANKPRQGFPKTYSPNGYIDVLKTSFVLENKMILGNRVIPFITPRTCEIDMEEDFEFIEWQINKNDEIIKKLFGG